MSVADSAVFNKNWDYDCKNEGNEVRLFGMILFYIYYGFSFMNLRSSSKNTLQSTILALPALFGISLNGHHFRHGAIKTLNNQRIAPLDDNGWSSLSGSNWIGDEMGFHLRLPDLELKQAQEALKCPYRARQLWFGHKSLYVFIDYYFIISKLEVYIIISAFFHLELLDFPKLDAGTSMNCCLATRFVSQTLY